MGDAGAGDEKDRAEAAETVAPAGSRAPEASEVPQVPEVPVALPSDYDGGDDSTTTTTFDGPAFRVARLGENRIGAHAVHRRPKEPSSHHRHLALVGLVLALVAAVAIGAGVSYYLEYWGGKTVPSVVGLAQEAATQRIS